MDGGNWLTAVGNLLLAGGVFEGATLIIIMIQGQQNASRKTKLFSSHWPPQSLCIDTWYINVHARHGITIIDVAKMIIKMIQ